MTPPRPYPPAPHRISPNGGRSFSDKKAFTPVRSGKNATEELTPNPNGSPALSASCPAPATESDATTTIIPTIFHALLSIPSPLSGRGSLVRFLYVIVLQVAFTGESNTTASRSCVRRRREARVTDARSLAVRARGKRRKPYGEQLVRSLEVIA